MGSNSHQKGNDHSSESPHFFKVIIPETLRAGKLEIPRKFVEKYGNGMSSPAVLRVPSGEVWRVQLIKCGGQFWLKNGWQEFSKHYSLGLGHFLVFRYEGNCNFHVIIFDKSASEIEYPCTSNYHGQPEALPQQHIKEFEDDHEQPIEILEEIPPSGKGRGSLYLPCPRPLRMMRSTHSSHKTTSNLKSESLASQLRHKGSPDRKGDKSTNSLGTHRLKGDKKAEALQRARDFKSENPFFLIVMQPSYVDFNSYGTLAVPSYFVKKHLMKKECEVTLYNSNGRTWTVSYHLGKTRKKGTLRAGWKTFAQDNNIQVNDVCAFELINCIQISFKVVIYPGQIANSHQPLPDAFHSVKGNAGESSQRQDSCESLSNIEEAKALQLASDFRCKNPFFSVVMQPSYVVKYLSVPTNFARTYFSKMHNKFIQLLSNGKSWPVKYYGRSVGKLRSQLSTGWRKFVEDNNLEAGDACLFELTKGSEISLKVTIYRKPAVEDANLGSSFADKSRENQVECLGSLVINAESNSVYLKADMDSLTNQHPVQEFSLQKIKEIEKDAASNDTSLEDKAAFGHEEASQRHPTLQHIEAIANQDTSRW